MSLFGGLIFKNFFVMTEFFYVNINAEIYSLGRDNIDSLLSSSFRFVAFSMAANAILISVMILNAMANYQHTAIFESFGQRTQEALCTIWCFFNKKCYFDEIYNMFLVRPFIRLSYVINRAFEDGLFQFINRSFWFVVRFPLKGKLYYGRRYYFIKHLVYAVVGFSAVFYFSYLIYFV